MTEGVGFNEASDEDAVSIAVEDDGNSLGAARVVVVTAELEDTAELGDVDDVAPAGVRLDASVTGGPVVDVVVEVAAACRHSETNLAPHFGS